MYVATLHGRLKAHHRAAVRGRALLLQQGVSCPVYPLGTCLLWVALDYTPAQEGGIGPRRDGAAGLNTSRIGIGAAAAI